MASGKFREGTSPPQSPGYNTDQDSPPAYAPYQWAILSPSLQPDN